MFKQPISQWMNTVAQILQFILLLYNIIVWFIYFNTDHIWHELYSRKEVDKPNFIICSHSYTNKIEYEFWTTFRI